MNDTTETFVHDYARAVLERLPERYETDAPMFQALWEAADAMLHPGWAPAGARARGLVDTLVEMLSAGDGRDGSAVLVLPAVGQLWCSTRPSAVLDELAGAVRSLARGPGRPGAGRRGDRHERRCGLRAGGTLLGAAGCAVGRLGP